MSHEDQDTGSHIEPSAQDITASVNAAKPKPTGSPVLLLFSGIALWGPVLGAGALLALFSHNDLGAAMAFGAIITGIGMPVLAVGLLLFLIYTMIEKPWRATSRPSEWYAIQAPAAVLAVVFFAWAAYTQHEADTAQQHLADEKARIAADEQHMESALPTDDAPAFAKAFTDCAGSCKHNSSWAGQAVLANAPHILAVLLDGMTQQQYEDYAGITMHPAFCRNGVPIPHFDSSLAMLAGFRNEQALIAELQPLWGPSDRHEALYGAVMAGAIPLMNRLVEQGVSPREAMRSGGDDSLYAGAAAGAAAESIGWLAAAGIRIQTDDQMAFVWRKLAEWAAYAPPDKAAARLDAWLAESPKILVAPGVAGESVMPLKIAVHYESPVLAQALLRHGYQAETLPQRTQRMLNAQLTGLRHQSTEKDLQRRLSECAANDWKPFDWQPFLSSFRAARGALQRVSPLESAVLNKDAASVAQLLSSGENPNDGGFDAPAPIFEAIRQGDAAMVTLLLKAHDIQLDAQNDHGETTLEVAVSLDNPEIVTALLSAGSPLLSGRPGELPR